MTESHEELSGLGRRRRARALFEVKYGLLAPDPALFPSPAGGPPSRQRRLVDELKRAWMASLQVRLRAIARPSRRRRLAVSPSPR